MAEKFFRLPFAENGDKTAVPDPTQGDGSVSYNQGYPPDYELDQSDPNAENVERGKWNQVMNDVTRNLRFWQTNGVYDYITPAMNDGVPFEYDAGVRVLFSGNIYRSLVGSNDELPSNPANWVLEDKGYIAQLINTAPFQFLRVKQDLTGYEVFNFSFGLDWIDGLEITNDPGDTEHDILVQPGRIMDSGETRVINLSAALIKQIDSAWALGNNQGGFSDQSVLSVDTWYRVFAISKASNPNDTDVIIASTQANALDDTNVQAEGFDIARRIGWVRSDSSSNIVNWTLNRKLEYFYSEDFFNTPSDSSVGEAISVIVPPNVTGVFRYSFEVERSGVVVSAQAFGVLTSIDAFNVSPTFRRCDLFVYNIGTAGDDFGGGQAALVRVKVDGSSEIRHREVGQNATVDDVFVISAGFMDDLRVA